MPDVGIRELLESGVHFGHQTRRWNPKMRRFIFGERDGIYIIDLLKTERLLQDARNFAGDVASRASKRAASSLKAENATRGLNTSIASMSSTTSSRCS